MFKFSDKDLELGIYYELFFFTGNLTACGNVVPSVWVAAQHAVIIFLIAHLARKGRTEHAAVAYNVTKFTRALR